MMISTIQIEFGVEYYPNPEEGEQWQELSESEFLAILDMHKARGLQPVIEYERFTIFDNGRDGSRITILDETGVYYG
jgi:hypothetical protein